VSCAFSWGGRKTYEIIQGFTRADGAQAATLTSTVGFLDLAERRLISDPAKHMRSLAAKPEILGL
jgi:acyl-CoA thioester hydrolase